MAIKDRQRGKAFERWVAGRLGWRRRRHGETANGHDDTVQLDGSLTPVSIECKTYAVLQLREAWVEQAKRNAGRRPWAIAQRPKGWRIPVVTIDWIFFEQLLHTAGYTTTEENTTDGKSDSPSGPFEAHH